MKNILTTLCLFSSLVGYSQYRHTPVHSSDSGQVLLTKLVQDYKPVITYTYAQCRDYMFKNVYAQNDTVECVYTGLKRYLNPVGDPSTLMYDNASTRSIDTEHTYPQNKVNNSAGRADLHHMFPTRARANNARGSVRFGLTTDNSVDKWFINNTEITTPPPANQRYLYSSLQNNVEFEPRDEHKGNVARAMFYFYTMYKADADAADPAFFNRQVNELCQWHIDDPVDSLEWIRSSRISLIQQNKVNPFVLDCTLPQRTYCSSISCTPVNVAVRKMEDVGLASFQNFPNPFGQSTTIAYQLEQSQTVLLEVYDQLGRKIKTLVQTEQANGYHEVTFDAQAYDSGIYYYKIALTKGGKTTVFAKKMVISK